MRLLVGIEATAGAGRVLREASERAAQTGDDLTVAILWEANGDADAPTSREAVERSVTDVLDEHGVDAEIRHLTDEHLGSRLLSLAEGEDFDRLVIGGGTESPMGKIQLGSITEFVLLNAQTTVTLVR